MVPHLVEDVVEGGLKDKSTRALILLREVGDKNYSPQKDEIFPQWH